MSKGIQFAWINDQLTLRWIIVVLALLTIIPFSSEPVFAKNQGALVVPPQNLARAGVSVVRLLVYYATNKTADATKPTAVCNGLGVLFSSKLQKDTSRYENWVLTDGTLVNPQNQATCLDGNPTATLVRIDVYASSAYSPQQFLLSSVLKPADNKPLAVTCRERPARCPDGPALFSFLSDAPQPFLDLVPSSSSSTPVSASQEQALQLIGVNDTSGVLSSSSQDAAHFDDYSRQAQGFLQPNLTASNNTRSFESGTPMIDSVGALSSLYLSNALLMNAANIQLFVKTMMPDALGASNPVHDNWNSGMDAYYKLHTPDNAVSAFDKASAANPRFEAATRFASLSQQPATTEPQTKKAEVPAVSTPSLLNSSFSLAGFIIYYWQLGALIVLLLIAIFLPLVLFRIRPGFAFNTIASMITTKSTAFVQALNKTKASVPLTQDTADLEKRAVVSQKGSEQRASSTVQKLSSQADELVLKPVPLQRPMSEPVQVQPTITRVTPPTPPVTPIAKPSSFLFISHSSNDDAFGQKLARDLRRELGSNATVWYDSDGGLYGGDSWWSRIVSVVSRCDVFIIIISPDSMSSRWVMRELDIALTQDKIIVPVLYRQAQIRADLQTIQYISFLGDHAAYQLALNKLLQAIRH